MRGPVGVVAKQGSADNQRLSHRAVPRCCDSSDFHGVKGVTLCKAKTAVALIVRIKQLRRDRQGAADPVNLTPPRVVLDTNVCLDLFLFADPRCARLAEALRAGAIEAVTRADARAEWQAVLAYPQLPADTGARTRAAQTFDTQVRCLPPAPDAAAKLPRCADPDDQKFLELAWQSGARWLLTRDNALLALARRSLREHGLAILTPQDWPGPLTLDTAK